MKNKLAKFFRMIKIKIPSKTSMTSYKSRDMISYNTENANANLIDNSEELLSIDLLNEYHNLLSQKMYWTNKHNALVQAFKILRAYDIDDDYTELILRIREALRYKKESIKLVEKIETDHPTILKYKDVIYKGDLSNDPILDRAWSHLETNNRKFDEFSFVSLYQNPVNFSLS